MRGFGAALALLALGAASAFAQSPVLPQSVVTNGEKIEWMRSEVTTISRRMSVEQTKPTAQQVEDVYVAAIVRLGDIDALSRSLYGVPDVDDAVRKYAREASMALDLARNARLGIGVPVDEIRTVKGKP